MIIWFLEFSSIFFYLIVGGIFEVSTFRPKQKITVFITVVDRYILAATMNKSLLLNNILQQNWPDTKLRHEANVR